MPYVKQLLLGHLTTHRDDFAWLAAKGELEGQESLLKTISELVYVINLLDKDESYKNY